MSTPLLQIKGLARSYAVRAGMFGRTAFLRAVDGVDLEIERGESLALVGESGCGKSTMARMITRLEPVDEGQIVFAGQDVTHAAGQKLRSYRQDVQLVFQDPMESLNPRQTVGQIVSRPLLNFALASGAQVQERVGDLLERVGLAPSAAYLGRYPHQLSGGQRQRVGIAAALAVKPKLLIADEPVASLDISVRAQILSLLKRLQADLGLSLLFISHDLGVVRSFCSRTSIMYLGKIVESGPTETVFKSPAHPYTRSLIAATPIPDPRLARQRARSVIRGEIPSALSLPSGCSFHPRCPMAVTRCSTHSPLLRSVGPGHCLACDVERRDL